MKWIILVLVVLLGFFTGCVDTVPDDTNQTAGMHNTFEFEVVNTTLKYDAIRYDNYLIDSGYVENVKPGDYTYYVGESFNQYNTCFLVYVSGGKLYYNVIDPYAIPGPDRGRMGVTFSGMLDENVESVGNNCVRFTYKGDFGVHVNWTDNDGNGYYAVIDQWNGLTEKDDSPAEDCSIPRELLVDSTDPEGVTFTAPVSGLYSFTVVGGAANHLPETDPNWAMYGGWRTRIILVVNKPVEWGEGDNYELYGAVPVNYDYVLGSEDKYDTYEGSETAALGSSVTIDLNAGDYVVALEHDHEEHYFDNDGVMRVLVALAEG